MLWPTTPSRLTLLRNTAGNGSAKLFNAAVNNPFPLHVDPEHLRNAIRLLNSAAQPASAERLRQLTLAEAALRGALNSTLRHVGYRGADLLERVAAGTAAA